MSNEDQSFPRVSLKVSIPSGFRFSIFEEQDQYRHLNLFELNVLTEKFELFSVLLECYLFVGN